MNYGVDVASTRLDDVDKRLIVEVKKRIASGSSVRVLDVGCGQGGLALALAQLGVLVTALDVTDYTSEFQMRMAEADVPMSRVNFIHGDIATWFGECSDQYDVVVLQRVLHYLPYTAAQTVLTTLRSRTNEIYLSVTGVNTAIAKHYTAVHLPMSERFGYLDTVGQELFSITAPLCLYSEHELLTLLKETGWQVTWSRVSDFGNIKLCATAAGDSGLMLRT